MPTIGLINSISGDQIIGNIAHQAAPQERHRIPTEAIGFTNLMRNVIHLITPPLFVILFAFPLIGCSHESIICCSCQATAGVWNREGTALSASLSADQENVYEPTLVQPEGNCLILTSLATCWKMWFTAGWASPNIYYAESADGITWSRYSTAVVTGHNRPFVIENGGTYYLYTANSGNTQIDEYTSSNGEAFALANAAVISGIPHTWMAGVANTSGIFSGGTLYLFVEGNWGVWSIGLFTSNDFHTFTANSHNPLISASKATRGGPTLPYLENGKWYMWVHGAPTANLPTDIYRYSATSLTGPWRATPICSTFPRATADEGVSSATGQVADPFILQVSGNTYMYYSASSDGSSENGMSRIKMAVAYMPISSLVGTNEGSLMSPPVASGVGLVGSGTSNPGTPQPPVPFHPGDRGGLLAHSAPATLFTPLQ